MSEASQPTGEIKRKGGAQTEPANPFIGAEFFRTGDKIFGRDREIEEFATRLLVRRVVLLHSPSGAGKTSLVQAGIIPALNRHGVHILPKIRINNELPHDKLPAGQNNNRYLASTLLSLDAGLGIADDAHLSIAQIAALSLEAEGLTGYLATHAPYAEHTKLKRRLGKNSDRASYLMFFDQFEEILTLDPLDADKKEDFFARLAPVLSDYRAIAIFAMREEYVAGLEPYLVYFPERLSARFRLELLGQEAALEAIRKPTQRVQVTFDRKGAELLVTKLSQITVREGGQDVKKTGQYVEPVQLQVVCSDLFELRAARDLISLADVEKQGSVENALGAYYDKKIKEVAVSQLEAERSPITAKLEQAKAAWRAVHKDSSKIFPEFNDLTRDKQLDYLESQVRRIQYEITVLGSFRGPQQRIDMLKQEQEALQELLHLYEAAADLEKPEKLIDVERKLRDWIEQELIVSGRLRGQAIAGEESKVGLDKTAVDKLVQVFLVREEPRRGLVWYELSHDSLVRPVVKSNAAWRAAHASAFELQAERWIKATEAERQQLLLTNIPSYQDVAWGEAHLESLTKEQKQYLSAARIMLGNLKTALDNSADLGINLEDTGWGVIFAAGAPSALREALKELLDYRRLQASSRRPMYYHEFFGADGYRPGETAQRFLARFNAGGGLANPEKMPYYLLIVGDPVEIPFEFQYGLDIQYAVGRIYFEKVEEYTRYARSVVLSETKHSEGFNLPNRLVVFAPQNPGDRASALSMEYLVRPMLESLPNAAPNWEIRALLAEQATKANLKEVLGGPQTPALLFNASHGMPFPMGSPEQLDNQGALICQDWPGPIDMDPITPDQYFSANDISEAGNLLGAMVFSFGEYVGGTPLEDNFPFIYNKETKQLAEKAFLARLPQKLLSHPRGGALAVVAHVERAWTYSFMDPEKTLSREPASDIAPYLKLLSRLMQGGTAGMAMEDLNRRYSYFSTALADELVGINFYNRPSDQNKLVTMMTQTIDARNYILIGDPAVRLPVRADQPYQVPPDDWERPVIAMVSAPVVEEPEPAGAAAEVAEPELLVEIPTPLPITREAAPEEQAAPVTGGLESINVDSLASALIKGQKLKLSDFK